MSAAPDLLTQYGLAVVFVWALAVQAGAPMPAVPMLLGAGALSGSGRMDLAFAIAAAMAAAVGADLLWYALGRSHGTRVLELLCRFSLDADSLIRHAKERFVVHRLRYLVLAKFLPGVNPLAALERSLAAQANASGDGAIYAGALSLYRELAVAVTRVASNDRRSMTDVALPHVA